MALEKSQLRAGLEYVTLFILIVALGYIRPALWVYAVVGISYVAVLAIVRKVTS